MFNPVHELAPPLTILELGSSSMEKSFKKHIRSLRSIFDFIDNFVDANTLSDSIRFALHLAVEELFTNMVKHNPGSRNDVSIGLEKEDMKLVLRLVDSDVDPFDPRKIPDANVHQPLARRRPGGLGIHLVKRYFDSFDYDYEERISTITLVKLLGK